MEHALDDELPPAYAPQDITDVLPIYQPSYDGRHVSTYVLRQTAPNIQTLSFAEDNSSAPLYYIKTFKTGGFMNRKPHVIITRELNDKIGIAEARFDIHGTGTTVSHTNPPSVQRLELEDSRAQLLKTEIDGMDRWWQPFPGNKDVVELTNGVEEMLARFVLNKTPPSSPTKKRSQEVEVGRLYVVDGLVPGERERLETVCSAIVVIERTRRRAAILNNKSSPYGVVRSMSGSGANYIPQ